MCRAISNSISTSFFAAVRPEYVGASDESHSETILRLPMLPMATKPT